MEGRRPTAEEAGRLEAFACLAGKLIDTTRPRWWVDGYIKETRKALKPNGVDEQTWATATATGEVDIGKVVNAIAKANRMSPGCVYLHPATAEYIARLTVLATVDGIVGKAAVKALNHICVPRRQSNFKRPLLVDEVFSMAKSAYREVLTVRLFYRHVKGKSEKLALLAVRKAFHDLKWVNDRLLRIVCGIGDDSTPLDAVAELYAIATGYHPTLLKRRLRKVGYKHARSREFAMITFSTLIDAIDREARASSAAVSLRGEREDRATESRRQETPSSVSVSPTITNTSSQSAPTALGSRPQRRNRSATSAGHGAGSSSAQDNDVL